MVSLYLNEYSNNHLSFIKALVSLIIAAILVIIAIILAIVEGERTYRMLSMVRDDDFPGLDLPKSC